MIRPAEAFRVIHIAWVLLRHGLDELVLAAHLFRPIRFVRFLSPFYWLSRGERAPRAVRIRRGLEDLGPNFVKFGQILSTRRDLLPDDIADELAKLQDSVPPFPGTQARAIIEAAYGRPVTEVFAAFEERPLASASISQVHAARLRSGQEVVAKVLRPGVARIIRRDIGLLYTIARLAQRYSKDARRLRPVEVVQEYEKTIFDELDLLREAANCSQLCRNFLGRLGADEGLASRLAMPGYKAVVERAVLVRIAGFDWNCPQHITPRFTLDEVEHATQPLRERVAELEAKLASCEAQSASVARP